MHHQRSTERYHDDAPLVQCDRAGRTLCDAKSKVDRFLAAHGTSYSELDRASSASSLGQLLFPRVPWVMASLQLPL